MKLDDRIIFYGMALPGLKESIRADSTKDTDKIRDYTEVECDTDDFSLDFTVTLVTLNSFEETDDEEKDELLDFLGIGKIDAEDEEESNEEISINIKKESNAITDGLSALQQQIMGSPTMSTEEKQALLGNLKNVGDNFKKIGNKLQSAKDELEKVKDTFTDLEEISDDLHDLGDRIKALQQASETYPGFAGKGECSESKLTFMIETEKLNEY